MVRSARGNRTRRARNFLLGTGAALSISTFAAGLAAVTSTSTAQREAMSKPPAMQPYFVPVKRGRVEDKLVFRAQVGRKNQRQIRSFSNTSSGTLSVTTLRVRVGSTVRPGDLLFALSGRPVIAVSGAFAAYRDLDFGARGPDVADLNDGLRSLGLTGTGGRRGEYTARTLAAIRDLYARHGYELSSPEVEEGSETTVAPQETELREAVVALSKAKRSLSRSRAALNGPQTEILRQAVRDAGDAIEDAKAARSRELANANLELNDASRRLNEADPDERTARQTEVELARNSLSKVDRETARAIQSARGSLRIARLQLSDARSSALSEIRNQLDEVGLAKKKLGELRREAALKTIGPSRIRMGEIAGIGFGRVVVERVQVMKGATVESGSPVMTLGSGRPVVSSVVGEDVGGSTAVVGMRARIRTSDHTFKSRIVATTLVSSEQGGSDDQSQSAESPASSESGTSTRIVATLPSSAWTLPVGESVTVEVIKRASSRSALVVPVVAIHSTSGGRDFVMRASRGRLERVYIRVLLAAGGEAAVVSSSDAQLNDRDRVRVA